MYRFFESIKVKDQKVHLLDFHQKRVNTTFHHYGNANVSIDLKKMFNDLLHNEDGLYKWKIMYDMNQNVSWQIIRYTIQQITNFELIVNNEINYSLKYEDRTAFEKMKDISKAQEVIIVQNGYITDTSFSNLLFLKNKEWFTPTTYLLNGVQRQYLLKNKKIKEIEISLKNIQEFTHFKIINAMNDFDNMFIYPIEKIINLPLDDGILNYEKLRI